MTESLAHVSKEFFIDGEMFLVRPLEATDNYAGNTSASLIQSHQYLVLGQISVFETQALWDLHNSPESFVYVAVCEENPPTGATPAGFAIYMKTSENSDHQMALFLTEKHHRSRLGFELADSLIKDASDHGVAALTIIGGPHNSSLTALANKLGMSSRLESGTERLVKYTLQVHAHPGIVKF